MGHCLPQPNPQPDENEPCPVCVPDHKQPRTSCKHIHTHTYTHAHTLRAFLVEWGNYFSGKPSWPTRSEKPTKEKSLERKQKRNSCKESLWVKGEVPEGWRKGRKRGGKKSKWKHRENSSAGLSDSPVKDKKANLNGEKTDRALCSKFKLPFLWLEINLCIHREEE